MRWLFVALLITVGIVVSSVSGRPSTTAPDGAGTFRVVTFNIHKGADRPGLYNLERTIDAIARLDADVVGLQEVLRNHIDFGCDDQPALITEGLRRRTGRPWTHVYVKAWITKKTECMRRGRGDDVETEGLALFAPGAIVASKWIRLSEGRVGVMARVASKPYPPVIVTHLSNGQQNQPGRVEEIAALMPWAETHGAGILMGDLNAAPQAGELGPLMARYKDAWLEAAERGVARGVESGSTRSGRRTSRIDYVLYEPDAGLALESVDVIDTSTPPGLGEVSDHRPVIATFRRAARP